MSRELPTKQTSNADGMPHHEQPTASKEDDFSERTPLKNSLKELAANLSLGQMGKAAEEQQPVTLTDNPIRWVQTLTNTFSWKLLTMVVCTNHLLKGFVAGGGDEGLVGKPIEFIFADLGMTAARIQMFKAVAIIPWALKPVIALFSDACPIHGYKKMPYVLITSVLALFGAAFLGFGITTSLPWMVGSLFLIFLQISSVDLLVETKQAEEVKQKAHMGPQFFTFTWLGINVGQVFGVCLVGGLIHFYGPRMPYLVALPFIALVIWPTACNYLNERPIPVEERATPLVFRHPILCSITLMIGSLAITLGWSTFVLNEWQLLCMAIAFALVVLTSFCLFIRREIAGPVVFYFLLGMSSFNIDGALFYFYTDGFEQYAMGPHFSPWFYTTGIGVVVFLGIMVGFISGAEIFKNWSYRGILVVTIVLRALTQLALVPVLTRWTSRHGISDHVSVLLVTGMDTMVFAWRWIPKQVMGAHLTPRGVEATMLGLTAGTFNLSTIISSYLGGFLLHTFGVRPTGEAADVEMFANLWKVQIVAALTPVFLLFAMPLMIPAKTQTEALIVNRPDSATHGSLFERLTSAMASHPLERSV